MAPTLRVLERYVARPANDYDWEAYVLAYRTLLAEQRSRELYARCSVCRCRVVGGGETTVEGDRVFCSPRCAGQGRNGR